MNLFPGVLDAALIHAEALATRFGKAIRVRARDYTYGFSMMRDIAQVASSGAMLWLLWNKKRAAIPVSIASAAIVAGLSGASAVFDPAPVAAAGTRGPTGTPTEEEADALELRDRIVNAVMDSLPPVISAIMLAGSASASAALPSKLDLTPRDATLPLSKPDLAKSLTLLYGSYTLIGHWLEMLFCQLIKLGVVKGDYDATNVMLWEWWLHPFPAEGIAGLLIALLLSPLRERLLAAFGGRVAPALAVSFFANQVVCTSIDYLTGMVANRNYELWDYRDMPFNFQGQVCLQNSLVYTTAATLVAWVVYPARDTWLRKIPSDVLDLGFSALAPIYAFLNLIYFV